MDNLLVLPSVFALSAKILIFWLGGSNGAYKKASLWLWTYFGALLWMNFIEALGFAYFNKHVDQAFPLFISYYLAIITATFSLLLWSLQVGGYLGPVTKKSLLVLWGSIEALILVPGLVVADVQSIGYTLTRVPGPAYAIAQFGIIAPLVAAFTVLIVTHIRSQSELAKAQAKALFNATLPVVLTVVGVAVLMAFGFKLNNVLLLSFATLFSLAILIYSESKPYRFYILPDSDEEVSAEVEELIKRGLDEKNWQLARKYMEFALLKNAMYKCNGNKTKAAKMLDTSLATVKRKCNDYNLFICDKDIPPMPRLKKNNPSRQKIIE